MTQYMKSVRVGGVSEFDVCYKVDHHSAQSLNQSHEISERLELGFQPIPQLCPPLSVSELEGVP